MATVIFLPYVESKAAGWCRAQLVGRCLVGSSAGCARGYRQGPQSMGEGVPAGPPLAQRSAEARPPLRPATGPKRAPAHSVRGLHLRPARAAQQERVEAFSDGVYAIVATLLILDIW